MFFAGLLYWGDRFKTIRRTTIIAYGIAGGAAVILAALGINHSGDLGVIVPLALAVVAAAGLFVLAGGRRRPSASSPTSPRATRTIAARIMGLYSVFLALGQIIGNLLGGLAADFRGLDGIFIVSFLLLGVALIPLSRLRRFEHQVGAGPAPGRPTPSAADGAFVPAIAARVARGARGAVVAPHDLRPLPGWPCSRPAAMPSMRRSRPTPSSAS